jgi:hypothetical protein
MQGHYTEAGKVWNIHFQFIIPLDVHLVFQKQLEMRAVRTLPQPEDKKATFQLDKPPTFLTDCSGRCKLAPLYTVNMMTTTKTLATKTSRLHCI